MFKQAIMPPMLLAQIVDAVRTATELADNASTKSDHALFIWTLVLFFAFCGTVIFWLVKHIDKKDAAIVAKDKWFEDKLEKKEVVFLASLGNFTAAIDQLTQESKATAGLVIDHDRRMTEKHELEIGEIVELHLQRRESEHKKLSLGASAPK